MAKQASPTASPTRRGRNAGAAAVANVGLSDRRVVEAARRIVAECGVDGLTMRKLSDELGVTLGATYRHVPSKRDVLLLVAHDLYGDAKLQDQGAWDVRVKRLMLDIAQIMSAHPGMSTFNTANAEETRPVELDRAVTAILKEAGFSRQGIDTVIAALFFYVHGIVSSGLISNGDGKPSQVRIRRLVERGLDLLLAGAKASLLPEAKASDGRKASKVS